MAAVGPSASFSCGRTGPNGLPGPLPLRQSRKEIDPETRNREKEEAGRSGEGEEGRGRGKPAPGPAERGVHPARARTGSARRPPATYREEVSEALVFPAQVPERTLGFSPSVVVQEGRRRRTAVTIPALPSRPARDPWAEALRPGARFAFFRSGGLDCADDELESVRRRPTLPFVGRVPAIKERGLI